MATGSETFDVRAWLYNLLSTDATLTAIVSEIHAYQLPQRASYPCVLFTLQSATDTNTLGQRVMDSQLWLVKTICTGESLAAMGPALARIDALLQEASATTNGLRMRWRREQTIEYPETDNGIRYNHAGAMYRCFASSN